MCRLVLSHHISSACCTVVLSVSEQSEIVKFLRHLAFYHRGREGEGEIALCFSCLRQVFSPNDTVSLRLYMHDYRIALIFRGSKFSRIAALKEFVE